MDVLESNRTRVTRLEMHGPMYTSYSDEALQAIIRFIWIGYINNILCYRDFTNNGSVRWSSSRSRIPSDRSKFYIVGSR